MVEFSPATREARVRFPANAGFMFAVWAMSFWKWRLGHPGLVPSENTGPHLDPLEHLLVSIVVSIPACHAGDRGSIPRRGVHQALVLPVSLPGRGPKERLTHRWRCRGLNSGPHTCEACALPLSYIPRDVACGFFFFFLNFGPADFSLTSLSKAKIACPLTGDAED